MAVTRLPASPGAQAGDMRAASSEAFAWAALAVGTVTLVACSLWLYAMARSGSDVLNIRRFVGTGVAILLVGIAAGVIRRRQLARVSSGVSAELQRAILPPVVACFGASVPFFWNGAAYSMGVVWMTCYGLALLNTRGFLSSAVTRTGWLFLGTGIALMSLVYIGFKSLSGSNRSDTQTLLIMALTFGGFHLAHALGYFMSRRST